jgi:hypothetical protein
MKRKKNILFTFDYELFLGKKSGSVKNCMIKPTIEVIKVLERYGLKGIFFVDCTYLVELKKVAQKNKLALLDFQAISNQLKDLIKRQHSIYPHIHPHWLDANYNVTSNEWTLEDVKNYRFHALSPELRKTTFKNAFDCLHEIIQVDGKDYHMNAYRAGGWSIQPFKDFMPEFDEHGIIADFSVLGGSAKKTNALEYDFTNIATNDKPYKFSINPNIKDNEGLFYEYPISSISLRKNSFQFKILNRLLWRLPVGQNFGDGVGVQFKSQIAPTEYDLTKEMVSIELLNILKLKYYKRFLLKEDYMQFISHPKMISEHNLKSLDRFLKFATSNYKINNNWMKI